MFVENNRELKSNYIFFWESADYYKYAFADIIGNESVRYIEKLPMSNATLLKLLHKIHNSGKINKYINLPFRNVWYNLYFDDDFSQEKRKIFIFHAGYYWLRFNHYFEYLKSKYNDARFVYFFTDVVESYKCYFGNKYDCGFDMEYIKKTFDVVLTYNKNDAIKYDLIYYPTPYSTACDTQTKGYDWDVLFVGNAKNRLDELHRIYCILKQKGFLCAFYIDDVREEDQKYENEIVYNQKLTYQQVIDKVTRSRGILEIVQKDSSGFTFRVHEALVYNKNLITNNPILNDIPYGNSKKIFWVNDLEKLEKDNYVDLASESFHYRGEYSPHNFLNYLENII